MGGHESMMTSKAINCFSKVEEGFGCFQRTKRGENIILSFLPFIPSSCWRMWNSMVLLPIVKPKVWHRFGSCSLLLLADCGSGMMGGSLWIERYSECARARVWLRSSTIWWNGHACTSLSISFMTQIKESKSIHFWICRILSIYLVLCNMHGGNCQFLVDGLLTCSRVSLCGGRWRTTNYFYLHWPSVCLLGRWAEDKHARNR